MIMGRHSGPLNVNNLRCYYEYHSYSYYATPLFLVVSSSAYKDLLPAAAQEKEQTDRMIFKNSSSPSLSLENLGQ